MVSQHLAQSLLKQMGGAVVFAGKSAVVGTYRQSHVFSHLEHAFCHNAHMAYLAALKVYGVFYLKGAVFIGDNTCISLLAAHGSVKRGLLHDDGTLLSVCKGLYQLVFRGQDRHPGISRQPVITNKFSGNRRIDGLVYSHVRTHVIGSLAGLSGLFLLFLHGGGKAVFIHGAASLFQNFLSEIQRESISIIQLECIGSGKTFVPGFLHFILHLTQDAQSLVNGLVELFLFLRQYLKYHGLLFFQLRIAVLGQLDYGLRKTGQEPAFNPQLSPMTGSTAQETAEHIAPSLVGRHDSV